MSDSFHLLVPGAGWPAGDGTRPEPARFPSGLPPRLAHLLARMEPVDSLELPVDSPAMPYEVVLARLLGLPATPGRTPWAAFETRTTGMPCAWLHPCHWQTGSDGVLLDDPARLDLSDDDSRALFATAAPYFAEDGLQLEWTPAAWKVTGEPLRDLVTWSMDRVVGRRLTVDLLGQVGGPQATLLRRLQNEMQMLFYAHPVSDARMARRQPPVNAFWLTGAGALDALPPAAPGVVVENRLHASALALDAQAHARAWEAVDADSVDRLAHALQSGRDVRLTLAGERRAVTWAPRSAGLGSRLRALFAARPGASALESL